MGAVLNFRGFQLKCTTEESKDATLMNNMKPNIENIENIENSENIENIDEWHEAKYWEQKNSSRQSYLSSAFGLGKVGWFFQTMSWLAKLFFQNQIFKLYFVLCKSAHQNIQSQEEIKIASLKTHQSWNQISFPQGSIFFKERTKKK